MQQNPGVKLYRFDGVGTELELVPLAARRALDRLGCKLSLQGFTSLSLESRQELTRAGSAAEVDETLARNVLDQAQPAPTPMAPLRDPSSEEVPDEVRERLGPERPLPRGVWSGLTALDRYALAKVCSRAQPDRIDAAYLEIVGSQAVSTHVRPQGGVHMVSVSHKEPTHRVASAESWVTMSRSAFERLVSASAPKGDVLATARLAGIMATKRTSDLIPLCHPLALEHAEIDLELDPEAARVRVVCSVRVFARTGVEMEAMVGASVAALTVYDMLKSVDRGMTTGPTRLLSKTGGKSGTYPPERQEAPRGESTETASESTETAVEPPGSPGESTETAVGGER